MEVKMEESWKGKLAEEFAQPYFEQLASFVRNEYSTKKVYPKPENIFRAFELCPFEQVKVVILGQDPYHGPKQAHGLAFSVEDGVPSPPSLLNIYKELERDLGIKMTGRGDLSSWAKQGVLLLNATLTVLAGAAGSHQNRGWERFTDRAVQTLANNRTGLVFMLWGAYAQKKGEFIDRNKHLVLAAPHPSPLSAYRGFLGCRHFSLANDYLKQKGLDGINWQL